jgi:4-hydroxy-tetrahydrodipicolinate reductase
MAENSSSLKNRQIFQSEVKIAVQGALGKMGREIIAGICQEPDLKVVGAVEKTVSQEYLALPDGSGTVPFSDNLAAILAQCQPQVLVDFTVAQATMAAVPVAAEHRVNLVIGTTGLTEKDLAEIDRLAKANDIGIVVAPNFALGAVVSMHLAKIAAQFFDWAEIIERHHEQKKDAPSGTALSTAKVMVEGRGKPFLYPATEKETLSNTRGGEIDGIAIHSLRLPGLLAHQDVVFGAKGQTLTIRHDTISRECYLPGVILAIRKAVNLKGLTYGLDKLLGL